MYNQRLQRRYPGLFVLLLDQSASMSEPVEVTTMPLMHGLPKSWKDKSGTIEKYTKADIATAVINDIIHKILKKPRPDQYTKQIKNYVYLCVLGYHEKVIPLVTKDGNASIEPIINGELSRRKPEGIRVETEREQTSMGIVSRNINKPYWIDVVANGRATNMALAFEYAKAVVERWLSSPPEVINTNMRQAPREECFPPVIINVTDAQFNEGKSPMDVVKTIQSNGTKDGNCLVFNCHFTTEHVQPTIFPGDRREVSHLDGIHLAEVMFDMSSPIPDSMKRMARVQFHRPISPAARGYIYNANPQVLIDFLEWGTLGVEEGTMPTLYPGK